MKLYLKRADEVAGFKEDMCTQSSHVRIKLTLTFIHSSISSYPGKHILYKT